MNALLHLSSRASVKIIVGGVLVNIPSRIWSSRLVAPCRKEVHVECAVVVGGYMASQLLPMARFGSTHATVARSMSMQV